MKKRQTYIPARFAGQRADFVATPRMMEAGVDDDDEEEEEDEEEEDEEEDEREGDAMAGGCKVDFLGAKCWKPKKKTIHVGKLKFR